MRYLSLCSGIEAASVAWAPLGWTPVAFAEYDPESSDGGFAAALLAERFPRVPNLGDISKISQIDIAALGPIDVVVGGTPCQDLSVAGQRAGLDGGRSNLFFDFVRIFDAARRFCGARWCLWENVPGAFSSNAGADFARVVSTLAGCDVAAPADGWGSEGVAVGDVGLIEWAVLDTQWFGLAQRRDRVFAILDSGDWTARQPVLLERESVRGDYPPSRATGARVTGTLGARTLGRGSSCGGDGREAFYVANTLTGYTGRGQADSNYVPEVADPISASEGRTYTHEGANNFRLHNVIAAPLTSGSHPSSNAAGRRREDDVNIVACFDTTQITHRENRSTCDPSTAALARTARPPAIALSLRGREGGNLPELEPGDVCPALRTGGGGSGNPMVLDPGVAVRRLTPTECERLQGFPDGWTAVTYRGKPATDTRRYAALGNSMGVPVLRWIGERLDAVTRQP